MSTRPAEPSKASQARPTPREIARTKQLERATELSALEPGALYIILFYRSTKDNDFHWAFYHHINANDGGLKLHIIGSTGHWDSDHGSGVTTDALADARLVGSVRLTNLSVGQEGLEAVRRIITAEDEKLNEIVELTCRVYIARACERLKAGGFLNFPDWARLQTEVFVFGNMAKADFADGKGPKPRPVMASKVAQ